MGNQKRNDSKTVLTGTTLRIYRLLYKQGKPLGLHDIQRHLGLSSASVSQYHIKKLLEAGLVKEKDSGYSVDRVVFENMLRVRRSVIPFQVAYSTFFFTMFCMLLIFLRPQNFLYPLFIYCVVVTAAAAGLFLMEARRALNLQ